MVANFLLPIPVLAESKNNTPDFSPPEKVDNQTVIKIDGSVNSIIVNQSLKENFEKQFLGTHVEIGINGNEDAIKSVLDGKVDLASLGRKLTPEEKAQGLKQVLVRREKIAIVVGMNNPFSGGLTTEQFAKIFQGEITNWSEIGKAKGKIRFIDRPSNSDTRSSFSEYSAFKSDQLLTGANAVQMLEDNTSDIIRELGNDGISYVLANQISKLPDVRVLKVKNYLPNNSKYPFVQSFVYVYKENPNSKVRDFLDFIVSKPGEESVKAAREAEALAIAASTLQTTSMPVITSTKTPNDSQNPSLPPIPETLITPQHTETTGETPLVNPLNTPSMITKNMRFFLLLPLLLIAGLSSFLPLWLRNKKRTLEEAQPSPDPNSNPIPEIIPTLSKSETFPSIVTNNHNGNGANHYKEDNSQETTAINNIAVIDIPPTTSTNNQIKEIPQTDLDYSEVVWDTEAPVVVVNSHFLQIPNIHHNSINANIPIDEFSSSLLESPEAPVTPHKQITSLSELLGITPTPVKPDSSLSELLNTATKTVNQTPQNQNLSSDLSSELDEALNPIINEITLKTPQIEEEISPTPLRPTPTNEAIAIELDAEIEAWTNINSINVTGNTRIIFTSRTPKWAYISWYISDDHQQTLQNQGFTILAIRVYDVTNLDLSYQRPEFVQQYECETTTSNRYVPIPRGERDYMTEIGYINNDNRWLCLARSGTVRVFSRPSADFWFVVDAELVLHGVTEEGGTVTIDGQKIKVNPDGTFKLTIPFVDNLVNYHITATSADQEHSKTIDKKFFQEQKEG
jgi:phosphate transport system substrate-binding protein